MLVTDPSSPQCGHSCLLQSGLGSPGEVLPDPSAGHSNDSRCSCGWYVAHCPICCLLTWQEQTCSKFQDDISAVISQFPLSDMLHDAISNKDCNASPWQPPPCLLGLGPWLANAVISLQVGHSIVKLAGMRFCEQNEGWVFCSKHSKCIMLVIASQATLHVPLHDFALVLQATAPVPLAGEDLRGRARGGISVVQHYLTAPPEGTAQLLRCG